jgi:REP element-mobilizing transposase RayT
MRDAIIRDLARAVRESDALLLAYAVMSTHLHFVLRQGANHLSTFLQPLLLRISLRMKRRSNARGHVFRRRYYHRMCLDSTDVRNVISYVHLNPVDAGICAHAGHYPWSSHHVYAGTPCPRPRASWTGDLCLDGMHLFARSSGGTEEQLRGDYDAFLAWRLQTIEDELYGRPRVAWPAEAGDVQWVKRFGQASMPPVRRKPDPPDLEAIALQTLRECAPDLSIALLRSRKHDRRVVEVRRRVIENALRAGASARAIALFLDVSDATVSAVARAMLRRST